MTMSKLDLKINLWYKSNWSNNNVRVVRKNKFTCTLLATLRKEGINAPRGRDMTLCNASKSMYSDSASENEARRARGEFSRSRRKQNMVRIKGVGIERSF